MSSSSNPRVTVVRAARVTGSAGFVPTAPVAPSEPTPARLDVVSTRIARPLVVDPALIEGARADGYQAGYDAGFEQGVADAASAAGIRIEARADAMARAAGTLEAAAVDLRARDTDSLLRAEDVIVAAAFRVAEVLLGAELASCERAGRVAIARALALAPNREAVVVRMHPDDIASFADEVPNTGPEVTYVADDTLAPGDSIVEAGSTRIDARIEAALERVRALLYMETNT